MFVLFGKSLHVLASRHTWLPTGGDCPRQPVHIHWRLVKSELGQTGADLAMECTLSFNLFTGEAMKQGANPN